MTRSDVLRHLASAGSKGGSANSDKQKAARRLNIYRYLVRKWPNSPAVKAKLDALEKELANG